MEACEWCGSRIDSTTKCPNCGGPQLGVYPLPNRGPTGLVIVDGIPAEQIKLMCENLERRGLTWHRGLAFVGNLFSILMGGLMHGTYL